MEALEEETLPEGWWTEKDRQMLRLADTLGKKPRNSFLQEKTKERGWRGVEVTLFVWGGIGAWEEDGEER